MIKLGLTVLLAVVVILSLGFEIDCIKIEHPDELSSKDQSKVESLSHVVRKIEKHLIKVLPDNADLETNCEAAKEIPDERTGVKLSKKPLQKARDLVASLPEAAKSCKLGATEKLAKLRIVVEADLNSASNKLTRVRQLVNEALKRHAEHCRVLELKELHSLNGRISGAAKRIQAAIGTLIRPPVIQRVDTSKVIISRKAGDQSSPPLSENQYLDHLVAIINSKELELSDDALMFLAEQFTRMSIKDDMSSWMKPISINYEGKSVQVYQSISRREMEYFAHEPCENFELEFGDVLTPAKLDAAYEDDLQLEFFFHNDGELLDALIARRICKFILRDYEIYKPKLMKHMDTIRRKLEPIPDDPMNPVYQAHQQKIERLMMSNLF